MTDVNEWMAEKRHECKNMGKVNDSNYDGNCMSCDFQFGTSNISGRWIFVRLSLCINFKTQARSHTHPCRGKAVSINYSICSLNYPAYNAHEPIIF